jgi:hypothetical protein
MSNLNDSVDMAADRVAAVRVAAHAGGEHLGASVVRVIQIEPGSGQLAHRTMDGHRFIG